jgi:hypothetical protein
VADSAARGVTGVKVTAIGSALLRGHTELEATDRGARPHRLPTWVRRRFPDAQLMSAESQPSGVRVVLRTSASVIELTVFAHRVEYKGAPRPRGCIDVFVNQIMTHRDVLTGGNVIELDAQTGEVARRPGPTHTTVVTDLPPGDNLVELWLPHNESLDLIELRSDAAIHPDTSALPTWLHHGSSISQGSNAAAPSQIWPVVAARRGNVDLRNLGFGGSALVDPFVARVIRDAPADFISVKLGINIVNLDAMRLRAFVPAVDGFLDTIREGHPDTPIVLISPLFCGIHEDTPGPLAIDTSTLGTDQLRFIASGPPGDESQGRLTLAVIRRELQSLVGRREEDHNLHYLDGTVLYGSSDADELPLKDNVHPDTAAHALIGRRFADWAFGGGGPFSSAARRPQDPTMPG